MKTKGLLLWVTCSMLIGVSIQAQDTNTLNRKYTPYELMSSYYDEGFKPFQRRNVFIGFSFALQDKRITNTDYLFDHVIDGERLDYNVVLKSGYYIGEYGMTGVTFEYLHTSFGGKILSSEGVVITSKDTVQSNSTENGFAISPYFRSTLPVTPNERLSFFTEFSITFGGSHTNTTKAKSITEADHITARTFNFDIGLSPGITFFALENFALEAQLNLLGYSLDVSRKQVNEGVESVQTRQNVDFNINILSLNLGLAYYFGAKRNRS